MTSFKRSGIAIFYEKTGEIVVTECRLEANSNKSFEQIYRDVRTQTDNIMRKINDALISGFAVSPILLRDDQDITVFSECPPPQGNFAPGLYALDVSIFTAMAREDMTVYRLYPTYVGHVHGKRKYNKSESIEVAREILSKYKHRIITKRFSHDEAEAVIFLARNMAHHDVLDESLIKKYPGLGSSKEEIL